MEVRRCSGGEGAAHSKPLPKHCYMFMGIPNRGTTPLPRHAVANVRAANHLKHITIETRVVGGGVAFGYWYGLHHSVSWTGGQGRQRLRV